MKTMGIRELKAHLSEAIRDVQSGETIEVTHHGEVVALLVPAPRRSSEAEIRDALESLDALAAQIGSQTPGQTDVATLLSEMRR